MKYPIACVAAAVALSACAAIPNREDRMVQGQPEPYRMGFLSGCASGKAAAGSPYHVFLKDAQRAMDEPMYAAAWNDGFAVCKSEREQVDRIMLRR